MTRPLALHLVLVCCLVAAALLAGCGGGGEQPDEVPTTPTPHATTQPVDCVANPKACA